MWDVPPNRWRSFSQGVEQRGIQKGIQRGILESIQALMETMNLSVQDAMDALKIKEQDRPEYMELLKDKEQNS